MVAINFKPEFAKAVESGVKLQTIRAKARCKAGDVLQLYTGQRTKNCRKLRDAVCIAVDTVCITPEGIEFGQPGWWPKDADRFAENDGFKSYDEMYDFFCSDHGEEVFNGYVILWDAPPTPKQPEEK
jgi:hypothetical protein